MLFKKQQDISGKYLSFVINCTQKLFEDGNVHYVLQHLCDDLGFEFAAIAEEREDGIHFFDTTISHLDKVTGNNPLILRILQDEEPYRTAQLTDILTGLLDISSIENLQYSRRIKSVIGLAHERYFLLVASSSEIAQTLDPVIQTAFNLIVTYRKHVLADKDNAAILTRKNQILTTLRSFTNFSILKTNFADVADFAVNQIAKDLDIPSIMIILREENTWKPIALTATPLILKVQEFVGQGFYKYSISDAAPNKALQEVLQGKIFKTHEFADIASPPLEEHIAKKVQQIQQVRLVYVIPLEYRKSILGCVVYMIDQKEIDSFREEVLKDYALQLSIAFANAQNISSMETSKQTIEDAYKKLEEVNKEKDNLMSMASHELRAPATVARNAISLINEYKMVTDPNVLDKLEMIKEAADRELSIINTMLEVSRINTKKMELVYQATSIEKLIQTAVEELRLEAEKKGLALAYEGPSSPIPETKMDPTRIREVIDNLLTNAIKYTETGSITVALKTADNRIEVSVRDTGRGIPDDVQATLFQMFHRITTTPTPVNEQESHQGGLGLGLFIAKNIIDAHNGTITVQSKTGEGSTFTFTLPLQ